MIDTQQITPQCAGPDCEHEVHWIPGHKKRLYCSDACRQRAHRAKNRPSASNVIVATIERQAEQRLAQLESKVQELQALLNIEQRYRTDYQVRHFKGWLRKHPQVTSMGSTDFFKRFLADTRLPQHASRSWFEAKLRLYNYSSEDIALFQETWKDMMFTQGGD